VYRDQADDGLHGPILSGKDVHSVAFGTLLDIHHNRSKVHDAVWQYFNGVNTWFTIVERASFEDQLETSWDNLPAEASILALCMALIALPANQKQSKGMGDTAYHSIKAVLAFVQSKITKSVQLLQAELLIALYEFSHGMPEQAYRSLGNCLQTTKMLGWHDSNLWCAINNQMSLPRLRELKLYSILWWAIVYVDW
jgi:fumarate reductase subunit D